MRAHTDEEIIQKASAEEKDPNEIKDNRIDVAVDLEDIHCTTHTYVVSFCKDENGNWKALEVSELSSL